jgi:hypothetical protein
MCSSSRCSAARRLRGRSRRSAGAGANPDDRRNAVLPKHQRIAASLSTIETILASSGAVERYD